MTNTIAIWLGAFILAIFVVDAIWLDWDLPVIIMREMLRLIDWLAFWR